MAGSEDLERISELLDSEEPPSKQELLEMLENANISDDMKESLRSMLTGDIPQVFGTYSTVLGFVFVFLIFSIIFFFGYKLYKSIKEKEMKKEEKKKQKQSKKKK
ncbi:uncharacterized protein LOC123718446 isoform X3 [Pieris brassicae]|uniref:uncharacterized protein LOC123718446 isoform X3 n=1 Tax=Pieris brassicae TaxID=7116 RepID=UPI001E6618E3|nr:uncharacterized protein LOC123718446 isoform X3 [Pieris brassicae]